MFYEAACLSIKFRKRAEFNDVIGYVNNKDHPEQLLK